MDNKLSDSGSGKFLVLFPLQINIEELSPLDLLMNNRRSELEIMFEVKLREKYIVDNSTVVPLFIWPLSL
jgi:hypothetical protein